MTPKPIRQYRYGHRMHWISVVGVVKVGGLHGSGTRPCHIHQWCLEAARTFTCAVPAARRIAQPTYPERALPEVIVTTKCSLFSRGLSVWTIAYVDHGPCLFV